jgi:hypothetical protein
MRSSTATFLLTWSGLLAQAPQPPQTLLDHAQFLVPIHSLPADPQGGAYGTWAAGADFKVSFHDGFVFYPRMGESRPNRPLRWTTQSVTAGGRELLTAGSEPVHGAQARRYTYDFGPVIETYDVRVDGVEQTFVIPQRVFGDVVVRGRITTELVATPSAAGHRALEFTDQGRPVLDYGAATAVDARGARLAITTACDGDVIELHVPGAWLDRAAFPVTIDPLLTRVDLGFTANTVAQDLDIAYSPDATTRNAVTTYSVRFAAGDDDAYALATTDTFASTPEFIFADVAGWGARQTAVGYSQSSRRWVVALTREFATNTAIRAYLHDLGNSSTNSGSVLAIGNANTGVSQHSPDVGGSGFSTQQLSPRVLITFASDDTTTKQNTTSTAALGQLVDTLVRTTIGTPFALSWAGNGSGLDKEAPRITTTFDGTPSHWVAVWQSRQTFPFSGNWAIYANKIDVNGTRSVDVLVGSGLANGAVHAVQPDVAGSNGRFMASHLRTDSLTGTTGEQLGVTRFDFLATGVVRGAYVVANATTPGNLSGARIAQDLITGSHWAIGYRALSLLTASARFLRLGGQGQVFESGTLLSGTTQVSPMPTSPSVTSRWAESGFIFGYGSNDGNSRIHGQVLAYPNSAQAVAYGSGCGGATNVSAWPPLAGSEFWPNEMGNAPPNQPAALVLSLAPANTPLDFIGMPGCVLHVDVNAGFIASLVTSTDATGRAFFRIPLLDVDYTFRTQWMALNPGSNALGIQNTAGLRIDVRR